MELNATAPDLREKRKWWVWGDLEQTLQAQRVLQLPLRGLPEGLGSVLLDLFLFQDRAQIWIFT